MLTILLTVSTLLFIIFNIILYFFPINKSKTHLNIERAEEYIYSKNEFPVVFVGSGLIGNLTPSYIKNKKVFNLFFPYTGSCTGVEIIYRSKKIPEILFIETNYIFKGTDYTLINKLFNNILYKTKFIIPSLLKKNNITALLKCIIKHHIINPKRIKNNYGIHKTLNHDTKKQLIKSTKEIYKKLPDESKFKEEVKKLNDHLQYISSKGCNVIMFEMPIDSQLINLPLANEQREAIQHMANTNQYKFVAPEQSIDYETEDGIHLIEESANTFFKYLNKKYEEILFIILLIQNFEPYLIQYLEMQLYTNQQTIII